MMTTVFAVLATENAPDLSQLLNNERLLNFVLYFVRIDLQGTMENRRKNDYF